MDTARAFSQLTLLGDKTMMHNVDFLIQPFSMASSSSDSSSGTTTSSSRRKQQLPDFVTVVPSKAIFSESKSHFSA